MLIHNLYGHTDVRVVYKVSIQISYCNDTPSFEFIVGRIDIMYRSIRIIL